MPSKSKGKKSQSTAKNSNEEVTIDCEEINGKDHKAEEERKELKPVWIIKALGIISGLVMVARHLPPVTPTLPAIGLVQ